jgi:hypothetical protein
MLGKGLITSQTSNETNPYIKSCNLTRQNENK